jgi:outer membrane protein assembly factor BamB
MKYDPMDGTQMWHLRAPAGASFGTTYLVPIKGYGYTTMGGNWSGTLVKWDLWHGRRDPTNLTRPSSTDFEEKIVWAKPMPAGTSMNSISGGVVYCQGRTHGIPTITTHGSMDTETGEILWREEGPNYYAEIGAPGYGVAAWPNSNDMRWYAHDLKTGAVKWVSDPGDYPWSAFWGYGTIAAYGNFYGLSYDGVYAMDAETGEKVWTFHPADNYDTVYNTLPFWQVSPAAADGKIYVGNGEHTMGDPMLRGCKLYCLDGATGDVIWNLAFGGAGYKAIADGKLIIGNEYDHHFYCFRKGPTATTVAAPKTQVIQGESLVIEGTITDQSPAQPGTAAIADEDMSAWMEYLHMQKPMPTNAKGVDVTLDVIDANGNFRNIGTATSDMSGVYSYVWKPDIPGKYTVIATFAGSESYGSSYAQTSFYVEEAPPPPTPPDPTPAPMTDTYVLGMGATAVVAIIVIGLVIILMLRKR